MPLFSSNVRGRAWENTDPHNLREKVCSAFIGDKYRMCINLNLEKIEPLSSAKQYIQTVSSICFF
jgi:hypothetical protein